MSLSKKMLKSSERKSFLFKKESLISNVSEKRLYKTSTYLYREEQILYNDTIFIKLFKNYLRFSQRNLGDIVAEQYRVLVEKYFIQRSKKLFLKKAASRLFCKINFVSAEFLSKDCFSYRDMKVLCVFMEFRLFLRLL